jgi:RsiW-degrading membrane proteinase PrsW (M82 family)
MFPLPSAFELLGAVAALDLGGTLPLLFALSLFGAAAVAWFAYFWGKDQYVRESLALRWVVLGGGVASVAMAWAGYGGLESLGLSVDWSDLGNGRLSHAGPRALAVGFVEELAKAFPVLCVFLMRGRRSGGRLEGLSFAACAGIGFATAESSMLFLRGELSGLEILGRAAAAPLTHALFSMPWGLALDLRWRPRPLVWVLGLCVAATAHGAYDLLLARPPGPGPWSAGIVLVLWVTTIVITERRSARAPGSAAVLGSGSALS